MNQFSVQDSMRESIIENVMRAEIKPKRNWMRYFSLAGTAVACLFVAFYFGPLNTRSNSSLTEMKAETAMDMEEAMAEESFALEIAELSQDDYCDSAAPVTKTYSRDGYTIQITVYSHLASVPDGSDTIEINQEYYAITCEPDNPDLIQSVIEELKEG